MFSFQRHVFGYIFSPYFLQNLTFLKVHVRPWYRYFLYYMYVYVMFFITSNFFFKVCAMFIIYDRLSFEREKNHKILKMLQEKRRPFLLRPIKKKKQPTVTTKCKYVSSSVYCLFCFNMIKVCSNYIQVKDTTSELMMISSPIG